METKERVTGPREMPSTVAECEAMHMQLTSDIIGLEGRLSEVRQLSRAEKQYADPRWYRNATSALAYLKADRQRLVTHTAALRKAERQAEGQAYDSRLIAELRVLVGEEAFHRATERARSAL